MTIKIPGKTFLLGEYAAINHESALLVTTSPCFEYVQSQKGTPFHPLSPAGQLALTLGLDDSKHAFIDPYNKLGGFGGSSAEFIAVYKSYCNNINQPFDSNQMLALYDNISSLADTRPSGYDIIAQSLEQCVYINRQESTIEVLNWSFTDLSFMLIHTGKKLATHEHLSQTTKLPDTTKLADLANMGKLALMNQDSQSFIAAVNEAAIQLNGHNLVASHSQEIIQKLSTHPEILASKGCGAMGADIILILYSPERAKQVHAIIEPIPHKLIVTDQQIYKKQKNA